MRHMNSSGCSSPARTKIAVMTMMNMAFGLVHESCDVCTTMPTVTASMRIAYIVLM